MKALIAPLLLASMNLQAEQSHTVPADVRADFKLNRCVEVLDYYEAARIVDKPYLYGVSNVIRGTKKADFSFIAWCKSTQANVESPYVLIAHPVDLEWPGGCKFPIRDNDFAGGLSLRSANVNLREFRSYAQDNELRGTASGPLIQSENDGLALQLFCHRGIWVQRVLD